LQGSGEVGQLHTVSAFEGRLRIWVTMHHSYGDRQGPRQQGSRCVWVGGVHDVYVCTRGRGGVSWEWSSVTMGHAGRREEHASVVPPRRLLGLSWCNAQLHSLFVVTIRMQAPGLGVEPGTQCIHCFLVDVRKLPDAEKAPGVCYWAMHLHNAHVPRSHCQNRALDTSSALSAARLPPFHYHQPFRPALFPSTSPLIPLQPP
jgi:hypothetical protein